MIIDFQTFFSKPQRGGMDRKELCHPFGIESGFTSFYNLFIPSGLHSEHAETAFFFWRIQNDR